MNKAKKQTGRRPGVILEQEFITNSADETRRVGAEVSTYLKPGDVIFLSGQLGGGKTTFVQGVLGGLGIKEFARSSSFILVNEYTTPSQLKIYHMDLYRLEGGEMDELGLEEYLYGDGITIIEWADKMKKAAIPKYWEITLEWLDENKRRIVLKRIEHAPKKGARKQP
jgi:tRNA threonylcarbamoyladenosine biosynthesis protein TsaE